MTAVRRSRTNQRFDENTLPLLTLFIKLTTRQNGLRIMEYKVMNKEIRKTDMDTTTTLADNRRDPGFWREVWQQARLVFSLLGDREVPFYLKILPFLTLIYLVSPIDLFPGGFDDMTVLLVGGKVFIELAPQHVVVKHLNAIRLRDGYGTIEEAEAATAVENEIIIEGEIIEPKERD